MVAAKVVSLHWLRPGKIVVACGTLTGDTMCDVHFGGSGFTDAAKEDCSVSKGVGLARSREICERDFTLVHSRSARRSSFYSLKASHFESDN